MTASVTCAGVVAHARRVRTRVRTSESYGVVVADRHRSSHHFVSTAADVIPSASSSGVAAWGPGSSQAGAWCPP
jgi:hypothetical protein